jgi:predicted nucleotidyltransferase
VEFDTLVDRIVDSGELKAAITELLRRKKGGQELSMEPRIPVISEFIETEIERLRNKKPDGNNVKPDTEKLSELFRFALEENW